MKQTVIRPVITEKSLGVASRGWYTFTADVGSSKPEIAQAIETIYGVTVIDVRTLIMPGKERRAGKRMRHIRKSDWKKALVRLKEGQKIDAFDVHESHPTHETH